MHQYWLFVTMCILLILLPGPDTAIATKNTLTLGKKGGLKTVFGTCCALLIHTFAAVVGLSAIITKSAFVFSIFKYVGGAYLIYLGVKSFISIRNQKIENALLQEKERKSNDRPCFKQGFLTNLLNPKVAVFFLTFLPQFVDAHDHSFLPFVWMGLTYIALTAIWFVLYILLLNAIRSFMMKRRTQMAIEGVTGSVLVGFGIKLALERH
ncbi:LysE family translocator [Rummeliibacillus suwonensis]|uniref:LysE family translocator n=1 Tax=Rummeliibacillus suwonensis TaxID=1306154 RepID=UPI0011B45699|nr:LysE family translocator [Rummeliibacillus suwonensis]